MTHHFCRHPAAVSAGVILYLKRTIMVIKPKKPLPSFIEERLNFYIQDLITQNESQKRGFG